MEKVVASPLKEIQDEPSGSTKEGEKVEEEQIASQGNTPTASSYGAPTPMEVDPAPVSLASQLEQEEKKLEEPMAPEEKEHQVVPPVFPQQIVGDQVVTQESKKVDVPSIVETSLKEKALVPETEKASEEK